MSLLRKLVCRGRWAPVASTLAALILAVSTSSGCTSDKANAVVELCGDLSVPEDIESVRVVIYDQNRTPLRQGVRELWTCPGPEFHRLPQTLEFEPVDGDVFIEVQGLKEGAPVIRSELRTTFDAQTHNATVSLTKACMGARCAAGETCVQGKCELVALAARAVSSCSLGTPADEPDAAADTGTSTDAQPTDADTPADAGHDANRDTTSGDDAATTDAGPTQTNPAAYLCPPAEDEPNEDEPDGGEQDAGSADDDAGSSGASDADGEEDAQ